MESYDGHESFGPSALLGLARASMDFAAQHDKESWLSLYAEDAVIVDPVGAPPSRSLSRFYDAFIAPTQVGVTSKKDITSEMAVFRSVTIHTANIMTGLETEVPANLLYDVSEQDGVLRIQRLQAHWEYHRMPRQIISRGARGLGTIAFMLSSVLRSMGPRWTFAYVAATTKMAGELAKRGVHAWTKPLRHGAVDEVFLPGARIQVPGQSNVSLVDFAFACGRIELGELIASGDTISGLSSIEWRGSCRHGAMVAHVEPKGGRLRSARWLWST